MEVLIQVAGWAGTFLIVFAYFLVSYKKAEVNDRSYQVMNLFGAVGVGVNVFHQKVWPAVALNVVWGIIAISALMKKQKSQSRL